eukprot:6344889-Prymnesium_polylepis.1
MRSDEAGTAFRTQWPILVVLCAWQHVPGAGRWFSMLAVSRVQRAAFSRLPERLCVKPRIGSCRPLVLTASCIM